MKQASGNKVLDSNANEKYATDSKNEQLYVQTKIITITSAIYLTDYTVFLKFNDGVEGKVDLKNQLKGEIFNPLKDINYFKQFELDGWTITWENGADFAPEFLYKLTLKQINAS
ncbi:MAG: DUF2442 domain-containing protein [Paludibacter sp.]